MIMIKHFHFCPQNFAGSFGLQKLLFIVVDTYLVWLDDRVLAHRLSVVGLPSPVASSESFISISQFIASDKKLEGFGRLNNATFF